jgi:ribonuclease Z
MIEVTFLGTGSAVPTPKRNHPAVLLKFDREMILFDCGEGTQIQFRKARISPSKLTRLFITHWHGDHVLGIPGLLQTLKLNDYSKTLEVYGPCGTKKYFKKIMETFVGVGKLDIKIHEVSRGKVVDEDKFQIFAEKMDHGAPCLAYRLVEKDRLRIDKKKLGKLKIDKKDLKKLSKLAKGKDVVISGKKLKSKSMTYLEKGNVFAIALDTRVNPNLKKIAKDADVFVCESTFLTERELAKEYGHMAVEDVVRVASAAKVGKLYLMHMSQRHELDEKGYLTLARKIFKNTEIARDLMKIEI